MALALTSAALSINRCRQRFCKLAATGVAIGGFFGQRLAQDSFFPRVERA
jgi:hypothetical protein